MNVPASAFYPAALVVRTPLCVFTYPIRWGTDMIVGTRPDWLVPRFVYDQARVMHPGNQGCEYHEYDDEMKVTLRVIGAP